MHKTKSADAVKLLEQLDAVINEEDNDVREVRIAKLREASGASMLNIPEKEQAEELICLRSWGNSEASLNRFKKTHKNETPASRMRQAESRRAAAFSKGDLEKHNPLLSLHIHTREK